MISKKNVIVFVVAILVGIVIAGIYSYLHYCKQEMREVDRYALPKVIEFMQAIDGWNYEAVKPFLTDKYINSLSADEWQSEFEKLSVLGALKSFARPNFVSHQGYRKYKICESAIDMYSVASEFDKDNAVIRIFFENNCGKIKVSSFIVTSRSIIVKPDYLERNKNDKKNEETISELTDDELEGDLDSMYEWNQEDEPLPELNGKETERSIKENDKAKNKAHGKAYRY